MQDLNTDIYQKLTALKNEILSVEDFYDLQLFLKVDGRKLEDLINRPLYYTFEIPKKKEGTRKIQSPSADLLAIQKHLNHYFQAIYLLEKPKEVHGFINKPDGYEYWHSIVSNAKPHVNKKHLLNMDLKDFFPSISAKTIRQILVKQIGINDSQMADVLALLCTYQKSLPIGAPTSPVLSNFACLEMDKDLANFCRSHNINYTRYADDLTFSCNDYLTETIIQDLRIIIGKHEFTINEKKFRLLSSKSKQTVTGIIVNKKVNVDRTYIRNIRAVLHHIETIGLEEAAKKHYKVVTADQFLQKKLLFKVKGQVDFIGQVRGKEDGIYMKLIDKLK